MTGYGETWMDNCDHATQDCFMGCNECMPGSTLTSYGECVCDEPTYNMTM